MQYVVIVRRRWPAPACGLCSYCIFLSLDFHNFYPSTGKLVLSSIFSLVINDNWRTAIIFKFFPFSWTSATSRKLYFIVGFYDFNYQPNMFWSQNHANPHVYNLSTIIFYYFRCPFFEMQCIWHLVKNIFIIVVIVLQILLSSSNRTWRYCFFMYGTVV